MTSLPPNRSVRADALTRYLRSGGFQADPVYLVVDGQVDLAVSLGDYDISFRPAFTAFDVLALTNPQAAAALAEKAYPNLPNRTSESSSNRVYHGGSWSGDARYVRAGFRYGNPPDYRYNNLGFRPVITASAAFDRLTGQKPAAPAAPTEKTYPVLPDQTVSSRNVFCSNRGGSYRNDVYVTHTHLEEDSPGSRYPILGFRPVIAVSAAFDRLASPQTPAQAAAAIASPAALFPPDRIISANYDRDLRSGSFRAADNYNLATSRYNMSPDADLNSFGFRPAFTAFDVLSLTQGVPAAPAVTQARPMPRAPAPPPPIAPPPPPPPPPPQITAPGKTSPLFLTPDVMVVKTAPIPKEAYLKSPFQPMDVPESAVVAFLSGKNASDLKPEMTISWSSVVDWYCSLMIPVPDQKNYFYLFDYVQTNDYSRHNAAIPFGWTGSDVPAIKTSYGGGYDKELDGEKYWRMHSAGGRSGGNEIFRAVGSVIYPGGAIEYALIQGKAGIYTDSGRTPAAEKFWNRAVATGLATRVIGMYDTNEYLPAERALASVPFVLGPYEPHGRFATMRRKFQTDEPRKFAARKKFFDKHQKVKKEIRLVRGEMLARAIFTLSHDSIKTVRDLIIATGNASALALFDSRPEIRSHAAPGTLAGLSTALRVRRPMPPIPAHLAGFVADAFNPY